MSTRSARLSNVSVSLGATATALVTPPTGFIALVKRVMVVNSTAGVLTMILGIGGTSSGQRLWLSRDVPVAGLDVETWFVVEEGETLYGQRSATGLSATCFGALLTAPV